MDCPALSRVTARRHHRQRRADRDRRSFGQPVVLRSARLRAGQSGALALPPAQGHARLLRSGRDSFASPDEAERAGFIWRYMMLTKSIVGTGRLSIACADSTIEELGTFEYYIEIDEEGLIKSAEGKLSGFVSELKKLFDLNAGFLKLQDGNTIEILPTELAGRRLKFQVSGPIPGY